MIPTRIGQQVNGGWFAGISRSKTSAHGILVAPKSTEGSSLKQFNRLVANAHANRQVESISSCRRTTAASEDTTWELPSKYDVELCYRNLKPSIEENWIKPTNDPLLGPPNGINPTSIPVGRKYTVTNPAQTLAVLFRHGSAEAFELGWYWTCPEGLSVTPTTMIQNFADGNQFCCGSYNYVDFVLRAVRRVLIAELD